MPTPTKVDGNFFDELELTRSARGHLLKALLWHFAAPPKQLSASETQRTETVRPATQIVRQIPDDPLRGRDSVRGWIRGLISFFWLKKWRLVVRRCCPLVLLHRVVIIAGQMYPSACTASCRSSRSCSSSQSYDASRKRRRPTIDKPREST